MEDFIGKNLKMEQLELLPASMLCRNLRNPFRFIGLLVQFAESVLELIEHPTANYACRLVS